MNKLKTLPIIIMCSLALAFTVSHGDEQEEQNEAIAELAKEKIEAVVVVKNERAQGSGFIIDHTGIIVTNYPVIKGASTNTVKLSNGSEYLVKSVIDFDPRRDIAIIKVNGWNLPTVSLGDSDKVEIGDRVLAIGSPQGLENTVSDGIVSAKQDKEPGFEIFQITTPISPGSSGGALFNLSGEVIGVAFLSRSGDQSSNFAVPINYVKTILQIAMPDKQIFEASGIDRMQQIKKLIQDYEQGLSTLNAEIASLSKETVCLKSGYKAVGKIIERTDDSVTIEVSSGGRMAVRTEDVASIKQLSDEEAENLKGLKAKREEIVQKLEELKAKSGEVGKRKRVLPPPYIRPEMLELRRQLEERKSR